LTGERKIVGMVLGFAAVAGVALMLVPSYASAQILDPPGASAAADARRRPQLRPSLPDDPDPTEEDVRWALSGNLCRCTGYQNIVKSVLWAAAKLRGEPAGEPAEPEPAEEA